MRPPRLGGTPSSSDGGPGEARLTPTCPWLLHVGYLLMGRERCLPLGYPAGTPPALSGVIGSREPPRLFLSSAFGNPTDLFKLSFL